MQYTHHTRQDGILFRLFVQRPSRNSHHTTPHSTTSVAPHNQKKQRHSTYTYMYVYMHVYVYVYRACVCVCVCVCAMCICMSMCMCMCMCMCTCVRSQEHVPSMMCTVPSLWPSTMVERSILDKRVDMTNHTAGKTVYQKISIPPGSKTATVQLLKKSTGTRNCNCIR